ncbi:MAG: 3'-5' exonuclease [Firmicutes bacterium]|nr:3'-5' exonuclease [Bacillota bacterium]
MGFSDLFKKGTPKRGNSFECQITDYAEMTPSDYVVFDVETTGLDSSADRIIEIAALKVIGGEEVAEYQTLVDPGKKLRKLSPKITELTGITSDQLTDGKPYEEMAKEFEEFIGDLPMVAHNSRFDVNFLREAFSVSGLSRGIRHIDTIMMAKKAWPYLGTYKLSRLIPILGLADHKQTHRAMDDVRCTKNLFVKAGEMLRAKESLGQEYEQVTELINKRNSLKTALDVFDLYSHVRDILVHAFDIDAPNAKILFGSASEYLESNFERTISELMKAQYEKERNAIQKLKTRRAIGNHIEKFKSCYLENKDKLTDLQIKRLNRYEKDLCKIMNTIAPEVRE